LFAIGAESAAAALNALGAAGVRGWPIGWVDTRSTVAVSLR
jgi:hypothetical protein